MTLDDLQSEYDARAKGYEQKLWFDQYILGVACLRKQIMSKARGDILDVAGGTGLNFSLFPPTSKITSTDLSPRMLEVDRVLKPVGRIQIADIALQKPVPKGSKSEVSLWTGCIAGALLKVQLERKVEAAGFKDIKMTWGKDAFSGAPQHSDAAEYGTLGVSIWASK